MSIRITPSTAADAERLSHALQQLRREDPTIHVLPGPDPGDVVVAGGSERHLEIAIDRLHKAGIKALLGRPEVMYREAVTDVGEGQGKHARQTLERGEYAHVKVRVHPTTPGAGWMVENGLTGGEIPDRFMAAVEQGIRERLAHGVLAGYAVHDVRIEISGGSYHDADSTDAAFRTAAMGATEEALRRASPILMEPLMRVDVAIPADDEADVTRDLAARRGRVESCSANAGLRIIRALVPATELFGYESVLRHLTQGRGRYTCELHSFVPCVVADDDVGEADQAGTREPRRPGPKPPDSAIAVPEPDE